MVQTADGTIYKSRTKVLLEFFRRSRDRWKQKCGAAKARAKKAENNLRWLQQSRNDWKGRAQQAEAELQRLREEQKMALP